MLFTFWHCEIQMTPSSTRLPTGCLECHFMKWCNLSQPPPPQKKDLRNKSSLCHYILYLCTRLLYHGGKKWEKLRTKFSHVPRLMSVIGELQMEERQNEDNSETLRTFSLEASFDLSESRLLQIIASCFDVAIFMQIDLIMYKYFPTNRKCWIGFLLFSKGRQGNG